MVILYDVIRPIKKPCNKYLSYTYLMLHGFLIGLISSAVYTNMARKNALTAHLFLLSN